MSLEWNVPASGRGKRLDHHLLEHLPAFSRARLQQWVREGLVTVNGVPAKPSLALRGSELIQVTPAAPPPLHASPEDLPLTVLYRDPDVVAIDKPAGMAVHPGAGRHSGTLVNALLFHFAALSSAGGDDRPGIVHRLDRQTSGVLLVALHDVAHRALAAQFAARTVEKTYLALVQGSLRNDSGTIQTPIARDPVRRIRMATRTGKGRSAHTSYRVLQRFAAHTFLEVTIGTGRTHQIRVHLSSLGHPVAGDSLYGGARAAEGRFFLHAWRIRFQSPSLGHRITVESPLAAELQQWLAAL